MGLQPDALLYETCLSEVMQLIHADAIRSGSRFQWKHYFDPSPDLVAEFESITNQELPELW